MFNFFKKKKIRFEKVSFRQFVADSGIDPEYIGDQTADDEIISRLNELYSIWENIVLPKRQTKGAAGYDFYIPAGVKIAKTPITIPTGIRVHMPDGYFLAIVPRSGFGFKHGMRLMNTVGIIDSDYYYADNEGHILVKVCSNTAMEVKNGERFVQGLFLKHETVNDETATLSTRTGGFGSTGQ